MRHTGGKESSKNMKKQKYRDIMVYDEKGKVAVTVSKITEEPYCCDSKQHIVRCLPFVYKARYCGELSIGETAQYIHKGDWIMVTRSGRCFVRTKLTRVFEM